MSYVRINNKQYEVPEFGFRTSKKLEQCGVSIFKLADPNYMFTIVSAFVAVVANVSPDDADALVEQHMLGGGELEPLYAAYTAAITESGFFKKLLNNQEEKEAKKSKEAKLTE